MRDFLATSDFSRSELESVIDDAISMKYDANTASLAGKSIALVFFDPSLRTRVSMAVAVHELGGFPIVVEPGTSSWTLEHRDGHVMDGDKTEHVRDFVRVLARYVSAIGIRTFARLEDWASERTDPVLKAFEKYSTVPIINLESAMHHPCQAMADMMTIRERFGAEKKRITMTWAWHPKALPMAVPNSFAVAAAQFGHDVTIAHPRGYELDDEILSTAKMAANENGGTFRVVNDIRDGFGKSHVIYAKSWGGKAFYGQPARESEFRSALRHEWIVDAEKMSVTDNAIFMHCLPVRRNVVVTDDVIDSPDSVIIDEAENRLHVQKAILTRIVK